MNIYEIKASCGSSQRHCVVADNMAEAERIFKGKYWPITITEIKLYCEYVQIQKFDEQPREAL